MACLKLASSPPDDARLALEATWPWHQGVGRCFVFCVNDGVWLWGNRCKFFSTSLKP